jgi:hypothetical protein
LFWLCSGFVPALFRLVLPKTAGFLNHSQKF